MAEAPPKPPEGFSEGAILRVLLVPAEAAGRRLDVFVTSQLRRTSRTRAQLIIQTGAYDPNGRRLGSERSASTATRG